MIINRVNDNMLFINADKVDEEKLKRYIIDEKIKRINNNFNFSISDLVLVRSIKENAFPFNGYYCPLNEYNCYAESINPFDYFLESIKYGYDSDYVGSNVFNHKEEDSYIYRPVYRDTKHFTINSLSSNINQLFGASITFNDRPIIIIEPFGDKIDNGLLVNLNPIDTFFNLHDTYMPVSKDALFLIDKDKYDELMEKEEYRNVLKNHKIYLFTGNPNIACDIALLNIGILPQHSVGQRELIEEHYCDGEIVVSDKKYLKLFRNYIEYLNQVYLNSSYIHLPKDIIISRKRYERMYPGMLHANTIFWEEEVKNNMNNIISAYSEYMHYLTKFSNDQFKNRIDEMIKLIDCDVKDKYPFIRFTFFELHQQYNYVMKEFLRSIKYDRFIDVTNSFNAKQLSKIDKKRIG